MAIKWATINDFPDYNISSNGEIVRIVDGKSPKQNVGNHGYIIVSLRKDGSYKKLLVNRLVCCAFHGEPPTRKHHAAHGNGNKLDNTEGNLRWATPKENSDDKKIHGTNIGLKGNKNANAKLSNRRVKSILVDTRVYREIALEYNVSIALIGLIKQRKIWKHIGIAEETL